MPKIEREDVTNKEWLKKYEMNRFVRIGDKFFYEEDFRINHASIAEENGVTEFDSARRPIVDDAGDIQIVKDKLAFGGFSISCSYRKGNFRDARPITNEIAKRIFGEENIY